MRNLFLILGALCLAYYLVVIAYAGIRASFSLFWAALGAAFLGAAAIVHIPSLYEGFLRIPGLLRFGGALVLLAGFLVFLAAQGCILSGISAGEKAPCDYVIVLGTQVRGTRISRALEQRLQTAAEYLREHEETRAIVSGGQGPGEDITEAEAMKRYLVEAGIGEERIIKEDRSVSTVQNILFSRSLIAEENPVIGIISNDFHVFRAVHIAKAQGISAQGIPASTELIMRPNFMTREAFALVKDLILGNAVF